MTRTEKAIKLFNNGTIDQSTFGQLACNNFTDEIIDRAVERKWISEEIAKELR